MDDKGHQQELYDYVRKLMERDRAKHNVLPLSKFGLMQITRQRVRPAVEMEVMETCPTCGGKGKIQPSILFTDTIEEECAYMSGRYGKGIKLHLHPYVYAYAERGWLLSLKAQWRRKYGIKLVENQSLAMLEMRFFDADGQQLQHAPELKPEKPVKPEKPEPIKEEEPKKEEPKKKKEKPKKEEPKKEETPKPKKRPARRKKKPVDNAEK